MTTEARKGEYAQAGVDYTRNSALQKGNDKCGQDNLDFPEQAWGLH